MNEGACNRREIAPEGWLTIRAEEERRRVAMLSGMP